MSSCLNQVKSSSTHIFHVGFSRFFHVTRWSSNGAPLDQVPYLQALDQETLVAVARKLTPQLFAPNEAIEKQSAFGQVDWWIMWIFTIV